MKGAYHQLLNKGWNSEKLCQTSWLTPLQLEFPAKLLKEILFGKVLIPDKNLSMKRTIMWCRFFSEPQCNPQGRDPIIRVSTAEDFEVLLQRTGGSSPTGGGGVLGPQGAVAGATFY